MRAKQYGTWWVDTADRNGEMCSVPVRASSESEARENAERWDGYTILAIHPPDDATSDSTSGAPADAIPSVEEHWADLQQKVGYDALATAAIEARDEATRRKVSLQLGAETRELFGFGLHWKSAYDCYLDLPDETVGPYKSEGEAVEAGIKWVRREARREGARRGLLTAEERVINTLKQIPRTEQTRWIRVQLAQLADALHVDLARLDAIADGEERT